MRLDERRTALATRCLWHLQEAELDVEGLLLTHVDGLTLTSTFDGSESTQRLAAVATTMFLLSEQASEAWGSGESMELLVTLKPEEGFSGQRRHVYMKPVGYRAVLVAVCKENRSLTNILFKLDRAVLYLDELLGGKDPLMPDWHR